MTQPDNLFDMAKDALNPSSHLGGSVWGSIVMMAMIRETIVRTVIYGVVSVPTAYYVSLALSRYVSDGAGLQGVYGFVSGVFSLRLLQRLFIASESIDGDTLLGRIIDRVIGPVRFRSRK